MNNALTSEVTTYSNSDNTMFFEFKASGDYSMISTSEGVARISEVGTYTKIANKLVFVDSKGHTESATIEILTRSTLVFISEENEDDERMVTRSFFEKIG